MILSILKVIGIILLILLIIFLLIVAALLFVQIRYEAKGQYLERPGADLKLLWWPILLNGRAFFKDGKFQYTIKAFGGVIMTNTDAKISLIGRKLFSEDETDLESETMENMKREPKEPASEKKEAVSFQNEDSISPDRKTTKIRSSENQNLEEEIFSSPKVTVPADSGKKKKRKSFFTRIKDFIQKIRQKLRHFIEHIKKINKKKDALLKLYHSKSFEKAKKDGIIYIRKFYEGIKPKILDGYVHFGFTDPATTGEVSGILALFLPLYDGHMDIRPEFETACLDGRIYVKGRFRLLTILIFFIRIVFNKNLIKVVKRAQTIMER